MIRRDHDDKRGVKSEDLVAMIDFLYHGEANVFKSYHSECYITECV